MVVLVVTFRVQPDRLDAFLESMLDDARGSVLDEPGCVRFDVVQDQQDPTLLCLYEVYRDQEAVEAHVQTPHYLRWQETTRDWFAGPVQVYKCSSVFMTEDARR